MENTWMLAWRNIGRNRRRTLLTSLAIALSSLFLIFLQSYINGIMDSFFKNIVHYELGHIKIADKEYLRMEAVLPKEHMVNNLDARIHDIEEMEEAEAWTARIKFHLMLSHDDRNEPCRGVGIYPEREKSFMGLDQHIVEGKYLEDSKQQIIIGDKLAEKLGVGLGEEVLVVTSDINYSTYALAFNVVGIFRTGFSSMDKHLFFLPISKAQELLDCGNSAHEILILLKDSEKSEELAAGITRGFATEESTAELTAVSWTDHFLIKKYLPFAQSFLAVLLLIIMMIAALVILNTMLMAVLERTHEIGILKSMGMKDRKITAMILIESIYICLIGSAIGGTLGATLSLILQRTGMDLSSMTDKMDIPIPLMNATIFPKFSASILLISLGLALVTSLTAAVYPALKASRMKPVDALRADLK